jgi:aldose 1-epimerase
MEFPLKIPYPARRRCEAGMRVMTETLSGHGFELALDPHAGGRVLSLAWQGEALLRASPEGPHDPRDAASFPLVPYSGRVWNGRFTYDGEAIALPANMPPEPHAIHGHGWQRAWQVEERAPSRVTLVYRHAADAWPWDYVARQVFTLSPDALAVTMLLTNLSTRAMPGGLGWHPYFARAGAQMRCGVSHVWTSAEAAAPVVFDDTTRAFDLNTLRRVDSIDCDHAFVASGAPAELIWQARSLGLTIEADASLTHWVVFVPPGADFFCVEPITHAPNALNMAAPPEGAGMRRLGPGDTLTSTLRLIPRRL